MTTGERGARVHGFLAGLAALVFVALVALVAWLQRAAPQGDDGAAGTPGAEEAPPNWPAPPLVPVASPAPSPPAVGSSSYVVPWSASPTPAPETPPPTPSPRVTPSPQPCVEYTWEAADSPAIAGQVLVEIRVRNRCGRVLQPLEVLFHAQGWREGNAIYSAQGNLLEKIYPDSVHTVMIALQGSTTLYDRIEVTPIDPPVR